MECGYSNNLTWRHRNTMKHPSQCEGWYDGSQLTSYGTVVVTITARMIRHDRSLTQIFVFRSVMLSGWVVKMRFSLASHHMSICLCLSELDLIRSTRNHSLTALLPRLELYVGQCRSLSRYLRSQYVLSPRACSVLPALPRNYWLDYLHSPHTARPT